MTERNIITNESPKSPTAEAYRTLRTNIQFSNIDEDIKSIVFTSSGPAEGKSTTAVNLAVTMAQVGKRVLILDADLRKPTVHKFFNKFNAPEYREEQKRLESLLVTCYESLRPSTPIEAPW